MDLESTPSTSKTPPTKPNPTRRKGKMAKHRDAEKFRLHHNQKFDDELSEKFKGLRTLPSPVISMFADLTFTPAIRPSVLTPVNYTILPVLVKLVFGFLSNACKVGKLENVDIIDFVYISVLQIQARCYKARIGSSYPPPLSTGNLVDRVTRTFTENIFPISHFVQLFGKVKFDNQWNLPLCEFSDESVRSLLVANGYAVEKFPDNTVPLGEDNPFLPGIACWVEFFPDRLALAFERGIIYRPDPNSEQMMFTRQFLVAPWTFEYAGLMKIMPARSLIPTPETIALRYHDVIGRVKKKVSQAIEQIDFNSEGHLAQLTRFERSEGKVEVWSDRFIPDDALVLGAVLQLYEDESAASDRRCTSAIVYTGGALERYARSVIDRVMAK